MPLDRRARQFFFAALAVLATSATAAAQPGAVAAEGKAPASTKAPKDPPAATDSDSEALGFGFGSYGRIDAATDLRGGTPEPVSVVAHGSRIVEPSYFEIDLYYRMRPSADVEVTTVTTIASGDVLFHYTGDFDASFAVRNLYAEAVIDDRYGLWVGSRMYRGDDIYLLDYWPLDDVNTLGAGVWAQTGAVRSEVHAGVNRLLDPYQFQTRDVRDPEFGDQIIPQLDRQRFITTAKVTYQYVHPLVSTKLKLYGEAEMLPSGTRLLPDDSPEKLPGDFGWTLGAELAAWMPDRGATHANLFVRFSEGLTAFDELAVPAGFDRERQVFPGASELVIGASANFEYRYGGVLAGGYARRFADADPNSADRDDGWEYILDTRPTFFIGRGLGAGVDVSYQVRFPEGIDPTELIALDPAVFQIAPMAIYSPFGTGSYARPQFRFVYRAAHLNRGARDLYAIDDPRRDRPWVHYLGVQAEWWFNSTYR
ncbi:MAG TPA: carbohydrate porin [Kofleriaceae bacterium]|nr:carbohydrate porin [Kofleriaceae bacterium]